MPFWASTAGSKLIKVINPRRYHDINGAAVERVKGFRIVSLLAPAGSGYVLAVVFTCFSVWIEGTKRRKYERTLREKAAAASKSVSIWNE